MTAQDSKFATTRLVLPLRAWVRSPALHRRRSVMFALFVGYPLLAGWFVSQQFDQVPTDSSGSVGADGLPTLLHNLKWLDWPFVAYFGAAWLVAIWMLVRPRITALPVTVVALVALVTGGPIAIWLETTFNAHTTNLFSSIFAIGGSEELAKIIPVLAAIAIIAKAAPSRARQMFDLSPTGFLYLGVVAGVVFGCAEAVSYIESQQYASITGQDSIMNLTMVVFLRLITDPLNHALWAGVTGFFIGLAVQRARRLNRLTVSGIAEHSWLIGIGLAIAATLHGVNDFAGNAAIQGLVDIVSALLLLGYALAGDVVEQGVADAMAPQWGRRFVRAAQQAAHQAAQQTAAHQAAVQQQPVQQQPVQQQPVQQQPVQQQWPAPRYYPYAGPQQFAPPPVRR
jgi:RsiW-degrading membrane proteinase PrsW (M82 family)